MNLNPIDFNYIDGENIYPLQEYIDEKLAEVSITGIYSSNVFLNNNLKVNDALYYSSASNLYLKNKLAYGEIRFSAAVSYPDNTDLNYGTKIDYTGRLQVYHNYNVLQPLFPAGWYNVGDEILQLKADGINTDAQLTILDAGLVYLTNQNANIVDKIINLEGFQKVMTNAYGQGGTYEAFQNILFSGNTPTARAATRQAYDLIAFQSQQNYQNALALGALTSVGIGVGGAILGYISSRLEQEKTSNALYNNSNIPTADKNEIYNSNIQSNILNISNFNYETSNLSIYQGFINSNIINTQFINSLNTNELKLNQNDISNIFISSNISSNLNIINGFLNSNITTPQFISSLNTSNIYMVNAGNINNIGTAYINVCQANSLSTSLNTNVGFPTSNLTGGLGDKILLRNGTSTTYPISCGIDSNYSLWHSLSSNNTSTAFDWYIDGTKKMSLKNNRLDVNTLIYQNGQSLQSYTQDTILNITPNVSKKYGFNFSCSTAIVIGGITYYKYDIDLRLYTQTKTAVNPLTPYRYFSIRIFFASAYFEIMVNNTYNVLSYEIAMSNEANAGTLGGQIGINILAHHIGNTPSNPLLVNILPSYFTLMRTTDFNYLSVISTVNGINLNCIIHDLLY